MFGSLVFKCTWAVKHHKTFASADTEEMENVIRARFPTVVQCLLELCLEKLHRLLLAVMRHQSFPQVLDVLEARDFR